MQTMSTKNKGNPYLCRILHPAPTKKEITESIQVKELNNKIHDLKRLLEDSHKENHSLKTLNRRQELVIKRLEETKSDFPRIIKELQDDNRVLSLKVREMKSKLKDFEKSIKNKDEEISSLRTKNAHLTALAKNKNLLEREQLKKRVECLEFELKAVGEENVKIKKKYDIEEKRIKFLLRNECMNHKETKDNLCKAISALDTLQNEVNEISNAVTIDCRRNISAKPEFIEAIISEAKSRRKKATNIIGKGKTNNNVFLEASSLKLAELKSQLSSITTKSKKAVSLTESDLSGGAGDAANIFCNESTSEPLKSNDDSKEESKEGEDIDEIFQSSEQNALNKSNDSYEGCSTPSPSIGVSLDLNWAELEGSLMNQRRKSSMKNDNTDSSSQDISSKYSKPSLSSQDISSQSKPSLSAEAKEEIQGYDPSTKSVSLSDSNNYIPVRGNSPLYTKSENNTLKYDGNNSLYDTTLDFDEKEVITSYSKAKKHKNSYVLRQIFGSNSLFVNP